MKKTILLLLVLFMAIAFIQGAMAETEAETVPQTAETASDTTGETDIVPVEKAGTDMLLIMAHPGDEISFFGGLLETYVGARGYDVHILYLSKGEEGQSEKAEKNLKLLGVKEAPEYWDCSPLYLDTEKAALRTISCDKLTIDITALIRKMKPAVVVTHGEDGEFGHGLHRLCSKATRLAVDYAPKAKRQSQSAKQYGTWQVQRLYLHDNNGEKIVTIDQKAPLKAFAGFSTLEVDRYLYEPEKKGKDFYLDINAEGYTKANYRLLSQAEGLPDPLANNLFYGIPKEMLSTPKGICAPTEEWAKVKKEEIPDGERPVNPLHYFTDKDSKEQEVILQDEEKEHWEYHSNTLSIVIEREHTSNIYGQPIAYVIADLMMNGVNEYYSGIREGKRAEFPWMMARRYGAVLAVTGDNMIVDEREKKGIIIRNGEVYNDRTAADTLAFMPDLSLEIYDKGSVNAQDLLNRGIRDTYSFGPSLIKNGKVNDDLFRTNLGVYNPRCGIGMLSPGHYLIICCDGRQADYSTGLTLESFSHMFYMKGCYEAYNLDGGSSSSLVFMGEMLNKHGSVKSDFQRKLPDMLMFGHSDKVPAETDPVYNQGYGRREP